ncbi:MAG TPA: hypothetical protein VGM07_02555 [Stellaceae bacterium]
MPISATAYAEVKTDAPGCVIALGGSGAGIGLTGGATLSADGCAVASNAAVTTHACSNTITTPTVDYNSGTPPSCSLAAPAGKSSVQTNKVLTTDPLNPSSGSPGSTEVTNATARIASVASITPPSAPSVTGGSSITLNSNSKSGSLPASCSTSSTQSPWTVTCTGVGPFDFNTITIGGGSSATFANTSSGATYNFAALIDSGSSNGLTFNGGSNATYNMAGGIYAHASAPLSFSAGTFNIGTTTCSSAPSPSTGYSICVSGSGSITFGGPSAFVLAGGIYQGAGGKPANPPVALSLGYGTSTNSFSIGKSTTAGYSLDDANGATLFGDATGATTVTCGSSTSTFCMAGGVTTSGGTCVALSAAAEHDIDGSINASGGIVLGSGTYSVNGYVALGNSGGGDVSNCPTTGTTTGLNALAVTLVISGANTVTCNGVASSGFCLGAGYSTVDLTAPTSPSSTAGLAVIGPQSTSNTAAAAFTTGATNTRISGAFYFPNGPVKMSGAASLSDTVDTNACLELIGSEVDLNAGSTVGTSCAGLGGGSLGTTASLVQ